MEFFDKLRITLSSPLKSHSSDSRDFKTWTLPAQNLKIDNIRLLLYRDCDRRGRKCLFDSAHVIKDTKTGKFIYLPVTNTGQVKDLSEWIFGCVPLSSTSTKRFHRWKRNYVWSKTFQAPTKSRSSTTTTCRNVCSGSSSCLSSNGDLTSSGYLSGSGIDDSSYDQSSTDSCRNWSLPIISPGCGGSGDIKMSYSLPSRLEVPVVGPMSKMLLGLAIVISTGNDEDYDDDDDDSQSREICDKKQLAAYITSMSDTLEFSTDWFSMISVQSFSNPPSFVETLYNFSDDFRQIFLTRLTIPLTNLNNIPSTLKYLPTSIGEFVTAYMSNDLSWVKGHPPTKRCKIVIIASQKRQQEVKSILTLLKLINQCSCVKRTTLPSKSSSSTTSMTSPHPPTTMSIENSHRQHSDNQLNRHRSNLLQVGSQNFFPPKDDMKKMLNHNHNKNSNSSPAITIHVKSAEESPTKDEIGVDVVAMNPEEFLRRTEDVKHLTRDSTKDSGISSTLSSTTSLKRSSTSIKFFNNSNSSSHLPLDSGGSVHDGSNSNNGSNIMKHNNNTLNLVDYGVRFHLGEESNHEQTFNTLCLSEPNLDKLKQPQSTQQRQPSNTSSIISSPPSLCDDEPSETYDSFDMLEDCIDLSSSIPPTSRDPINIQLDDLPTTKLKIVKFCSYCDSISIVDKFNPLFQIQWLKLNPSNSTSSLDVMLGEFLESLDESWLIYNVDKNIIKYYNAKSSTRQCSILTNPSSTLVTNLLEHVQVLMNNSRESEIEQFVSIQLEFIRKLSFDFGSRLMQVTKFDVNSMPYVCENDLGLLFSLAGWCFPELRERFFV